VDATPPTVAVTAPTDGGVVFGTVGITASASDNVRIEGVLFLLDDAPLGPEDVVAPYEVAWSTTGVANGSHLLKAVARDGGGNQSTSAITVTVANDLSAPTVTLRAPAAGATVSGTVGISATAADDQGVFGVQFRLDGAPLGGEDGAEPFEVAWNTLTASNGLHTLTAVARDAAGKETTASVVVTVANDTTAPTIALTSPAGTVTGTVTIAATATDDIAVSGVRFLLDGSILGVEDTAAPYEATWATLTAANGVHTITAVARDGAGRETTASTVVTVANDTTPPAVAITSPVSGGSVTGIVALLADVSDDGSVAGVQFELDGAPLGAEDTVAPYEFLWNTANSVNGGHTLGAVARDAAGNHAAAGAIAVTVANDLSPPAVALTSPAAGSVSGTLTIAATATDDVAIVGVQFLVDGVNLGAEDTTAPYEASWATLTVPNGDHTLTAVARDAAGHTAMATSSVSVTNDLPAP
jgi:hypothetical protein